MTLKDAITTLVDFYGIEFENGDAVAMNTILSDSTHESVWSAWGRLGRHARLTAQVDGPIESGET